MNKKKIITVVILAFIGVGLWILNRNIGMDSTGSSSEVSNKGNTVSSEEVISGEFEVGEPAPEFTTVDFEGNKVNLSDFRDKAVVLDFWAAWCPFCIEELPVLEDVHQETKDEVVFLGIHRTDSGESVKKGKEFADDKGVTYLLLKDPTGEIYRMATKGLNAMPTAVFIDKDGVVRNIKLGPKTEDEIKSNVMDLLK